MARARLAANNASSNFEAVGKVIVAAWLKSLPDASGKDLGIAMDANEIKLTLTNILQLQANEEIVVLFDGPQPTGGTSKIHVIVPQLPIGITTKEMLITYLHGKYDASIAPTPNDGPDNNPFNPKNKAKHGDPPFHKRTFASDFGDATLFGCGR
jgi:hypothetical protein